jgi:hypothetical protein
MLLPVALLSFAALAFLVSRYGAGFLDIASDKAFKISVFVMVPVCVVCLAGVLLRRLSLRWLAALPLVFMCVFGAVYAVRFGMLDRRQDNIAHAYSFLGDDPALPVFTDHRTTWGLLMYWAFDPPVQLKTFDETPPEEIPPNSYVLVNAKELFFSRLTYGKRFSETLIPENWPDNWVCERICNADIRHGTLWIVRVTDLPQSL